MSSAEPIGVCLLYMGGPRDLGEVQPFLRELFSDRDLIRLPGGRLLQRPFAHLISSLRAPKVRRYYSEIGGGSPLGAITDRQAQLLGDALGGSREFVVAVAMRYAAPRANEALARLVGAGVRRCIALPLYPQYSGATSGSSFSDLARAKSTLPLGTRLELHSVESFHDHPAYLDALAAKIAEALATAKVPAQDLCVVFSAHSLPQRMIDEGDPYQRQVEATVRGVAERLALRRHVLGYQSRSGPVRWLEPEVTGLLDQLIAEGERHLVIVPVSFVSDHIETLHEIDIRMRAHCLERGAEEILRAPSLNDDPRFIAALAQIVRDAVARF